MAAADTSTQTRPFLPVQSIEDFLAILLQLERHDDGTMRQRSRRIDIGVLADHCHELPKDGVVPSDLPPADTETVKLLGLSVKVTQALVDANILTIGLLLRHNRAGLEAATGLRFEGRRLHRLQTSLTERGLTLSEGNSEVPLVCTDLFGSPESVVQFGRDLTIFTASQLASTPRQELALRQVWHIQDCVTSLFSPNFVVQSRAELLQAYEIPTRS